MENRKGILMMNDKTQALNHYLNENKRFQSSLIRNAHSAPNVSKSFLSFRQEGLEQFIRLDLPHKKREEWRHTNLSEFLQRSFFLADSSPSQTLSVNALENLKNRLVFINGQFQKELSAGPLLSQDLKILPLPEFFAHHEEKLHSLKTVSSQEKDAFAALNQAFSLEGAGIEVPARKELSEVLHIVHIATNHLQEKMVHPRFILLVNSLAKLQLMEHFFHQADDSPEVSPEDYNEQEKLNPSYFTNCAFDIFLEEGAKLEHTKLQREGQTAFHFAQTRVFVERDASYRSLQFHLGSKLSRNNLSVTLKQPGAACDLLGLYALKGKQESDHYTTIDHQAEHTSSHQLYKGILDDQSHGVFSGQIVVAKGTKDIQSAQLNKNLILNNLAHIHTQPQLQIYADDVKCSHGATIGQLNEEEIFYLESRGIRRERAQQIVSEAFAFDVLNKIQTPEIQNLLRKAYLSF